MPANIEDSFVQVSPEKVLKACDFLIVAANNDMRRLQESRVLAAMRGSLFKPGLSREQAIESLYGSLWNDRNWCSIVGDYATRRGFELEALAKVAVANNERVYLYAKDAVLLSKYMEKA